MVEAKKPSILDSTVWGPPFWFFLHTIVLTYPLHADPMTKKKYFELIRMIPLLLPNESMGHTFSEMLEEYPVTPYLDTRESFTRWMHFIHNKINQRLEKPTITLEDFYQQYYQAYLPKPKKWEEWIKTKQKLIYGGVVVLLLFTTYFCYGL